ncbi:hypothetical protein DMN91_009356 [Ooceraea biroi]|uniref:Uncharacterized protein n=1 Tax=Ooceraea biroi TaxID=2015173 RepID=A0A3L8DGH5_OOCBI|nr:hypothetical protein DMN91_009356 [Ooceraea biroi]
MGRARAPTNAHPRLRAPEEEARVLFPTQQIGQLVQCILRTPAKLCCSLEHFIVLRLTSAYGERGGARACPERVWYSKRNSVQRSREPIRSMHGFEIFHRKRETCLHAGSMISAESGLGLWTSHYRFSFLHDSKDNAKEVDLEIRPKDINWRCDSDLDRTDGFHLAVGFHSRGKLLCISDPGKAGLLLDADGRSS